MSDEKRAKCLGCKTKPTKSVRSKWCFPCYKKRRTKQLKANNVVWRKRVKKGTAGHHVRYRKHPTEWAAEHKTAAIAQVKKYKVDAFKEEALKILEKAAVATKKKTPKKAAGPVVLKRKAKVVSKPKVIKAKPPVVRKAKTEVVIPLEPVTVEVTASA